jgi:2-iminobutanoate/2-iminopropanoate deaminase
MRSEVSNIMTTPQRGVVSTDKAPGAIGPYSQAITVGTFIFTSGQVGFDPATGILVGEDVASQARQGIENMRAVLQAAGTDLDRVVKTTVFLVDMADFAAMNEVYATYFTASPPARSTVAVAQVPRNARFEIECVALLG